jgi:hypothetical protein
MCPAPSGTPLTRFLPLLTIAHHGWGCDEGSPLTSRVAASGDTMCTRSAAGATTAHVLLFATACGGKPSGSGREAAPADTEAPATSDSGKGLG